jgi:predicted permease
LVIPLPPRQGLRVMVGVGYVIARAGSRILRLDRQWEKFVVACTIFQNVLPVPGEEGELTAD